MVASMPPRVARRSRTERSIPAWWASRRMRCATARARTQQKMWTRILGSVQWNIGENPTTCGSLSWRNPDSTSFWERYAATTSAVVQSSWSVTSRRVPKIWVSSASRAARSMCQVRRIWEGVCPTRSVLSTRATHRGWVIRATSASTAAGSRRVLPRARVAASSRNARVVLVRVWSKPRAWAACRAAQWVRTTRRSTPNTTARVSQALSPTNRSPWTGLRRRAGTASRSGKSLGDSDPTKCSPVQGDRFVGLSACDTRAVVFGVDRRVVLTHCATLHAAQARGFDQTLAKTTRALGELAATLARGKTRREPAAVLAEVTRITHPRWVARVLSTELVGQTPSQMRLTWHIDLAARDALETQIFGKRLLVTDHDDWTTAEVVAAYRSQTDVASGFRQLKDPHVVGFSPMFHWTDPKIRVHIFYCVLALAVAHLMRREAHHAGMDLSVRDLLATLGGIEETVLLYPTGNKGRPRAQRILTDTDLNQKALFDLFKLDTYAPTR